MSFNFRKRWQSTGKFDFEKWRRERKARAEEAKRLERQGHQPTLNLDGAPVEVLCDDCRGLGCGRCANKGVVSGEPMARRSVSTKTCPRCYGVGHIANKALISSTCSRCLGTGKVANGERE